MCVFSFFLSLSFSFSCFNRVCVRARVCLREAAGSALVWKYDPAVIADLWRVSKIKGEEGEGAVSASAWPHTARNIRLVCFFDFSVVR